MSGVIVIAPNLDWSMSGRVHSAALQFIAQEIEPEDAALAKELLDGRWGYVDLSTLTGESFHLIMRGLDLAYDHHFERTVAMLDQQDLADMDRDDLGYFLTRLSLLKVLLYRDERGVIHDTHMADLRGQGTTISTRGSTYDAALETLAVRVLKGIWDADLARSLLAGRIAVGAARRPFVPAEIAEQHLPVLIRAVNEAMPRFGDGKSIAGTTQVESEIGAVLMGLRAMLTGDERLAGKHV